MTTDETREIDRLLRYAIKILHALGYKNCSMIMRDNDMINKSIEHLHYHIIPETQIGDLEHDSDVRKTITKKETEKILAEINKVKKKIKL